VAWSRSLLRPRQLRWRSAPPAAAATRRSAEILAGQQAEDVRGQDGVGGALPGMTPAGRGGCSRNAITVPLGSARSSVRSRAYQRRPGRRTRRGRSPPARRP